MGKIVPFPPPTRENEAESAEINGGFDEALEDCPLARSKPAGNASLPDTQEEGGNPETDGERIFDLIAAMPNCISRKFTLQALAAIGFLLAGFAVLIFLKSPQSIFFFLVAGWVIWNAVLSIDDFKNGRIIEQVVVCVSVKVGLARNTTRLVMRTANEEEPSYYEFCIAGRQTKEFTPNKVYIIYTKEYMPQSLFAYQEL